MTSLSLFQSTLPREERLFQSFRHMRVRNFNPRSHERSDVPYVPVTRGLYISIHAPTRGATELAYERFPKYRISIHAPTRGATGDSFCQRSRKEYFNPRSHERSDWCQRIRKNNRYISIHAPTRGATAILHKKFVYFYTIPTINI